MNTYYFYLTADHYFTSKNAEKANPALYEILKTANSIGLVENGGKFTLADEAEKTITNFLKENSNKKIAIFSFVNTNKAHHLSYYLAREAARRFDEECYVLNIDAHADCSDFGKFNGDGNKELNCGNWGTAIVEKGKGTYTVYGAFEPGTDNGTFFKGAAGLHIQKDNFECFRLAEYQEEPVLKELYTKMEQKKFNYLSIDMDFLPGPDRTNWPVNDSIADINLLKELVKQIPDKSLCGADITGFPNPNAERMNEYLDDIYGLYNIIVDKLK